LKNSFVKQPKISTALDYDKLDMRELVVPKVLSDFVGTSIEG